MHWSDKFRDIPFKDKGRDYNGCDCWGFLRLVFKDHFGIELLDHNDDYENIKDRHSIVAVVNEELPDWIEVDRPECGNVVLVRCRGLPVHVGVMINRKQMLHIMEGIESTVERLDSVIWKDKVKRYYSYAGRT